jgi:signal transduction histidine kinase
MHASLGILQRRARPSLALGVLVAVLGIAAETSLASLLTPVTPVQSLDVVYLLGIVAVASVWGPGAGLTMAVASTVAFDLFLLPPAWTVRPYKGEFLAVLGAFLAIALLSSTLAKVARLLTLEVDARQEADRSADLARLLLRAPDLATALPAASRWLAQTFELPSASIERGSVPSDEWHEAFPLRGNGTLATLLVPAGLKRATLRRLRERVVPSLEVLLQAAGERETVTDTLRSSRDELRRIADEQSALRRLATLVAHAVPPAEVLDAFARETGRVLGARHTLVARYDADGTATSVGVWKTEDFVAALPPGSRWHLEKGTVAELVWRTRRPGRIDAYVGTGEMVTKLRDHGIVSSVGCPITVGHSLWGVAIASSSTPEPLAEGIEERMFDFTELAAAAIANAQSHADLKASRARVVAAADETRRRIERDLHDGAQQRLIAIGLQVRAIEAAMPQGLGPLKDQLARAVHSVEEAIADLQEISRGLHPAILARGGLAPTLTALARRSPIPVELDVSTGRRLGERLEVTIYYVASEALTNVAKHAHASVVYLDLTVSEPLVRLSIRDDGVGGADAARGSGLIGLTDRVEAVGGKLEIVSVAGHGTTLIAEIPADTCQLDV